MTRSRTFFAEPFFSPEIALAQRRGKRVVRLCAASATD